MIFERANLRRPLPWWRLSEGSAGTPGQWLSPKPGNAHFDHHRNNHDNHDGNSVVIGGRQYDSAFDIPSS